MESASEKKQTACKDVNKSARDGICTARQGCLEHRWYTVGTGACTGGQVHHYLATAGFRVGVHGMGPSMGRVRCGVGGPGRDAVKHGTEARLDRTR